jgi:hypothetical protein
MSHVHTDNVVHDVSHRPGKRAERSSRELGVRIKIGGLYLDGDRLVSVQAALPNGQVRIRDEATGEGATISPGRLRARPVDIDQEYAPAFRRP